MGGRRLVCVTNIPTPYRTHLFNTLADELSERDVHFEVRFMAVSEPNRLWTHDPSACRFKHRIDAGFHVSLAREAFHLNPFMISSLLGSPPNWLLLGGSWAMPSVAALLVAFSVVPHRTRTLLWAEAGCSGRWTQHGMVSGVRTMLARCADGFVVPGKLAEAALALEWRIEATRCLYLPNVVDENLFRDQVSRLRERRLGLRLTRQLADEDLVYLWPARLHESTKGIINFLKAVGPLIPKRARILIAGEGPDRNLVERFLSHSTIRNVRLLGYCQGPEMLDLLALSDAVLLPSVRDPNPLTVIEALWAGLPLLISKQCGNWPETVAQGVNGWVVDSSSPVSMREGFSDLAIRSTENLSEMGTASRRRAALRFASRDSASRFVDQLLVF